MSGFLLICNIDWVLTNFEIQYLNNVPEEDKLLKRLFVEKNIYKILKNSIICVVFNITLELQNNYKLNVRLKR